ncbi:MAG: hypothetical protein Q7J09_06110, partial [Methanocalculus sp.]|uniref:hypothetical protein n=1 Tax=Methanocalculus sp. TaxID=2004547 RepID=UPI00271C0C21
INLAGGVTIANADTTNAGSFTVVATSVTDGPITGTRQVILSDIPLAVTQVTVAGTQTVPIPGSGQPSVTKLYTAAVIDQFGNTMPGEAVTWALQAPVTGVSINQAGGVTVANADTTNAGSFTVVVTSVTNIMVKGTLNVILSDVPLNVTQVTVTGTQTVPIPGSGQPAVTKIYTAAVIDQFGNAMPGEAVTWALQAPVAGVSINLAGGVTVANADTTSAGSFTVVATSVTNVGVSGTLNVILSDVPLNVTQVTVTGTQTVPIPESGQPAVTKIYTATVLDQFGNAMPGETVTWALQAPVSGVTMNTVTGIVTVANADTTSAGSFTVVATSVTNVGVSGTLNVILSDVPLDVTQVTVAGTQTIPIPGSGQPAVTKIYTATVLDQFGNAMPGEAVTWALQAPVAGVSINLAGGVTIANADTTSAGSFTVVATSSTNVGVSGTLNVILSDVPLEVEVLVEPASSSIGIGETEEYSIVLSSLPSGLGSFDVDVTLTEPGIARIVGVEVIENGTHSPVPAQSVNCFAWTHIPDGSENVVIVTVTIEGLAEGTTGLTVSSAVFYPEYEPVVAAAEIVVGGSPTPEESYGVFRENNGVWYFGDGETTDHVVATWKFGKAGDIPFVSGDHIGVFRPGNGIWYFGDGETTDHVVDSWKFGKSGDLPVAEMS